MAAQGYALLFRANKVLRLLDSEEVREMAIAEELHDAISKLRPLLGDAQEKSGQYYNIKMWLEDVEQHLCYVEESLEEYMIMYALKAGTTHRYVATLCFSTPPIPTLDDLVDRFCLGTIRSRIREAAREGAEELTLSSNSCDDVEIRIPSRVSGELFQGRGTCTTTSRDRDRKALMDFLLVDGDDNDRAAAVLAIVGSGVGKTALARDVFDDQEVQARFKLRIWWSFDSLLDPINCEDVLQQVHGVRYLIVLGHLSFPIYGLDLLMKIQARGAPGSRILVTTRPHPSIANTGWQSYNLLGLSAQESRDLFVKMAFQGHQPKSEFQVRVGEEIAKCFRGFSTTAALAIGGMLHFKDSEADWRSLYENELLPIATSRQPRNTSVDPFTKLCYDHLPHSLKHCFAYCSLFPMDHEFDVQMLIKLWMAQGFIDQGTSSDLLCDDLEEVGYEYFLNLLGRSFFHEAKLDASGRVTNCKMHCLMHKLSTFVAGERCKLFTRAPDREFNAHISHLSFGSDEVQLLCILKNFLDGRVRTKLRSILFPIQMCKVLRGRSKNHSWFWTTVFNRSVKNLRALDMHGSSTKTLPDCLDRLKHLRYLDLSQSKNLTELPDSITKLRLLETLKLSSCFSLKQLPRDIGNLVNLRHLENGDCHNLTSLPRGFGRMTNLRTLSQIILSDDASKAKVELDELKQLRNLRDVKIKNLKHRMGDQICKCLKEMKRVRSLSLEWERRPPPCDDYKTQLGSWLCSEIEEFNLKGFQGVKGSYFLPSSPTNLIKLTLRKLEKCEILTPLDQCLKLKVLVVDEMHNLEYISDNVATQICPSLEELWLTELPKLKSWWRNSPPATQKLPSFLRLSKLVIEDCPELGSMPLFPTLQEGLVLDSTSWKPFELTMEYRATPNLNEASSSSPTKSSLSPLSELKSLCIVGITEVDNSKAEEIKWDSLKSLKVLKFDHLSELTALPGGLQQVTSLQELHVWRCGLEDVPDWISNLKLLERLVIRMCPRAKSLPGDFRGLKHLRTLKIEECPTLLWRCRKETGADWDKVAHIPKLHLGRILAHSQ